MLVVKLEYDLSPLMRNLVFHALMQVNGVESVDDLSAISAETLRQIMRAEPELPARKARQRRKVA